jgi:hypothetical protein
MFQLAFVLASLNGVPSLPAAQSLRSARAVVVAAQQSSDAIRIRVDVSGHGIANSSTEWTWLTKASGYERDSASTVSDEQLRDLRALVFASRDQPHDATARAERVGFTPASLAAHYESVLALAYPPHWKHYTPEFAGRAQQEREAMSFTRLLEAVVAHVEEQFTPQPVDADSSSTVLVTLPGEPRIDLQAEGYSAYMLPWKITAGSANWAATEPRISTAIARLIGADKTVAHELDGEWYWRERFWSDREFWNAAVGVPLDAWYCAAFVQTIPGYADAARAFEIDDAHTRMGSTGLVLRCRLAPRSPNNIDRILTFTNLSAEFAATQTWPEFTRAIDLANRTVERNAWLGGWKRARPDRTIELHIVGGHAWEAEKSLIATTWAEADLPGSPDMEVFLRAGNRLAARVWLAADLPSALITEAKPVGAKAEDSPSRWFEDLVVSLVDNGSYTSVDLTNGKVHTGTARRH